ncbi:MAG: hypothetical protein JSR55_01405 [Proteobacteria bacterium]|nr:hypothetical protein [Pseudomonadota bacterium]
MTADLDTLLCQPLAPVADSGFSASVARRALALQERDKLLDQLVLLVTMAIVLLTLPLGHIVAAIETVTVNLGNLLPVAIAALVLTASFARLAVDRPE